MIGLVTNWQLVKKIKILWVDSEVLNQIQGFSNLNPINYVSRLGILNPIIFGGRPVG